MAVGRHALALGSKGRRSRSPGYKMRCQRGYTYRCGYIIDFYFLQCKNYPYIHGYSVTSCNVGPRFIIPSIYRYKRIYGTGAVKIWKNAAEYPRMYGYFHSVV